MAKIFHIEDFRAIDIKHLPDKGKEAFEEWEKWFHGELADKIAELHKAVGLDYDKQKGI